MIKKSKLLEKLFKKYNLKIGMKITYKFIEEIYKKEKLEIKDLECIFQIDSKNSWELKNRRNYTILRLDRFKNLKLGKILKMGYIDLQTFNSLMKERREKPTTLARNLGISEYSKKKLIKKEKTKVRIKDIRIKHIVDLILIDIKYIESYKKDTYYTKEELIKICKERGISLNQFLMYLNNNQRHYKFNKIIIEENENGIYIGKEIKIPDEFINKNYEKLYKKLNRVLYKIRHIVTVRTFDEDLIQDAINNLWQRCGNIVMNFSFDTQLMFNILGAKSKYIMIRNYIKNYNSNNIKYI